MTANDLIAAFQTLADAPDGVKRLRELVLQLAVRGKLVAQDPEEAIARALLDGEGSGKNKARPGLPSPNEVDVPYVAPPGWVWTTAMALGDTSPRNQVADDTAVGFVPMAVVPKEYRASLHPETRPWAAVKKGFTHIADGDIAVAKITPCFQNGKACVVEGLPNGVGAGTTELLVLRPHPNTLNPRYALTFFKSPDFVRGGVETFTGTAGQQRVSTEYFRTRPFPLPPLAEQHRIVARVDELMGLLDRLEAARTARDDVRRAARDAALAALRDAEDSDAVEAAWGRIAGQMDAMFADPEDVGPLRDALLTLAVRGKLVPQDASEEPASALLSGVAIERRRRWRSARPYPEPEACEEAAAGAVLPRGWGVSTIEALTDPVRTVSYGILKPGEDVSNGVPYVKVKDIRLKEGDILTGQVRRTSPEIHRQYLRSELKEGDVLVSIRGTVGKVARVPASLEGGNITQDSARLAFIEPVHVPYLTLAMRSPPVQHHWRTFSKGAAVQGLNIGDLRPTPIPIPPLAEQHRIVAKVDALMALCDDLEARLTAARDLHAQFAAAAVHHLDV